MLTADRYAKLYAVNYVGRAIRNPHSNPTTKAVAANYTLATADEKQNTTRSFLNQPYRYDRVLSPQAMTSNAVYEHPMNGAAKRMYQNEQLAALRNDKWGSSLKLALPTDFSMRAQHHIKTEALQPAQRRAQFRFDNVSPWRQYASAQNQMRNPAIARCK